jgi:alkanesulfonate monooxygenase SsuD/methylene tetrahydromethanopterin reductase-like flavin-dependent oxidoreductase (luciferase family)
MRTLTFALISANWSPQDRVAHLLEEIELADEVGLDVFGIGEHPRAEFLDSAPETLLAAAASVNRRIALSILCFGESAMIR